MSGSYPKLTRHFSSPIIVDWLDGGYEIEALRQVIKDRKAADPVGIELSNIGGWHSDTDMLEWGGEPARALMHRIAGLADQYTFDLKQGDKRRYKWLPEMWANISAKNHANQYHTHPGAFWSAVVYIDDGNGSGADRMDKGGEITFLDPRMPMVRMLAPDLRIAESADSIEPHEMALKIGTGMLLLFPGWLSHSVKPYLGDAERISIATNLVPLIVDD